MKNIIEINNLTFKYGNKTIFENLNLNIKENTFITLAGPSGSGKSTLLKMIIGLIETNNIKVCGKVINKNNLKEIRKNVSIVFENPNNSFTDEIVKDNLIFPLENLNLDREQIDEKINEVSKYFKISNLLECHVQNLSGGEKELVALAVSLITDPKILLLDESLIMLDNNSKEKILKLLKKLNKDKKITIINVTHDMEESTYSKEIAIINNGKLIIQDKIKEIYKNEKLFKDNNLELPFMVSLSNKLKYYGLVDDIILDMDKMVDKLWK